MSIRYLAAAFLVILAAGCGGGSAGPGVAAPAPLDPAEAERALALQPGDVIRLRIWREPQLSGEYVVDADRVATLPKIGPVEVSGLGPAALEAAIRDGYGRYLRNPSIEITLLRRINILGSVRAPGLYPVDPTMTLRDAVAMAGGVLPAGRQDRVELVRGDQRLVTQVTGDTRIVDLGVRSGDQIYVPERPWLSRNAGIVATVASTVISATVSLIIAFSR